jgi:predicted 3-demethylubiquinone-9 3-methyltransferase (glyoxalase superfamily)
VSGEWSRWQTIELDSLTPHRSPASSPIYRINPLNAMKTITFQKFTPCLWFDGQAEEAARFYTGIFKNSKIRKMTHYGDGAPLPKGTVLTVLFSLDGQEFLALNGGPQFKFTEAISFIVNCQTQKEIDRLWEKLSAGGQKVQCGWLKDKFGLSWQVVPTGLEQMIGGPDPARSQRVFQALMKMKKLDIAELKKAYGRK